MNAQVLASVEEMDTLELHYENILRAKVEADPDKMLAISKDKSNTDNPMDRENVEDSLRVETIRSLQSVYTNIQDTLHDNFHHLRVPVVEDCKPDVSEPFCYVRKYPTSMFQATTDCRIINH